MNFNTTKSNNVPSTLATLIEPILKANAFADLSIGMSAELSDSIIEKAGDLNDLIFENYRSEPNEENEKEVFKLFASDSLAYHRCEEGGYGVMVLHFHDSAYMQQMRDDFETLDNDIKPGDEPSIVESTEDHLVTVTNIINTKENLFTMVLPLDLADLTVDLSEKHFFENLETLKEFPELEMKVLANLATKH